MKNNFKRTTILSMIITIAVLTATLGGLLIPNLYQDNAFLKAIWISNDYITLIVGLPLLVIAMLLYHKTKSLKALLVWFSSIWFMFYNYAYYLFGSSFNPFFLIYIIIFCLSLVVLMVDLGNLPLETIKKSIQNKLPVKTIAGYMFFIAIGLTVVYTGQSINFITAGTLPSIVTLSGHVTSVVFILDFAMVITLFVISGVLLLKRNPWGYVGALMLNIKGVLYMSVLTFAALRTNPQETGLWALLGTLSLVVTVLLMLHHNDVLLTKDSK